MSAGTNPGLRNRWSLLRGAGRFDPRPPPPHMASLEQTGAPLACEPRSIMWMRALRPLQNVQTGPRPAYTVTRELTLSSRALSPHAFVSYSHKDRVYVDDLVRPLHGWSGRVD
jgi:hypothetical protein